MRISETLSVTLNDMDEHNKLINVTKSKTAHRPFELVKPKTSSSVRQIEMPHKWFNQLDQYKQECSQLDEHIFGESTDTKIISKQLQSLLEAIGSSKIISPHGLRHTHASVLISNGIDINYTSARLGHSNVTITQNVYSHLLDSHRKIESEKTINIFDK
ncbi:site-specific integrase [Weissella coleopterorum]|uniref:Site-specific integrase n=1 Tax=Weissella coleopterorum TaxID=2714949 RepID=A0A6G8AZU7_9LACO|nr:site-specific integrase [Weissella coleopterorum]QIL50485.1 site-specific integrase [Weissella coleopterorum]